MANFHKQRRRITKFIPGSKLSQLFYQSEVKPILEKHFPMLAYSAALIGWGSEVLHFDTPISRDHHWVLEFYCSWLRQNINRAARR